MSQSNPILSLHKVDVMRGEMVLCSGLDLTLMAHEICHIIGENGLGKTTLLNQIIGLLPTEQGQIHHHGAYAPVCVLHQTGIHDSLTVRQNLTFLASLYGVRLNDEKMLQALEAVGLFGYEDVLAAKLSAGQGKRVGLARLFLSLPSNLWVLDEPLTALDVAMIDKLQLQIKAFAQAGGAVLMTSHQPIDIATTTLNLSAYAHDTCKQCDE